MLVFIPLAAAHCLLLLAQVTTLNVAFNSQNRSLLTVIISNNFVELKGNVFRKMGKSNLFQIACADVRERFHYTVWLFIIVCRNMSASGWQYEDFLALLPDILLIFLAEVAVDWIKHAFISKFNVIASDVYEEYTVSIAYDLLLCHQGKNTSDYFELLARRMGLTPISLSCLINVMIIQTVKSSWIYVFLLLALPLLFAFKVLAHIVLLNRAYTHVQAYTQMMTAKLAKETASTTATAQFSNKTSNFPSGKGPAEDDAPKRKTSMFYPPYTGYDQPTRDDYQLAMPQLPYRRTHSDSTCISMPHAVKEGTPRLPQSYDPGDTAESIDEFSSLNSFPTNSAETPIHQRPPPPPPPQKGILKVVGWPVEEAEVGEETDSRFRQFLLDADDMQICRRRNIGMPLLTLCACLLSLVFTCLKLFPTILVIPSLPSSPTETAVIETRNQDRSSPTPPATASTFFKSQPSNPLFYALTLHPVPLTSSRKSSPKRHLATQRRRCFSLDDLMSVSPHQERIQHPAAPDSSSTNVVGNGRNPAPFKRCRLHTETEISSSIILEQLNSVLNDETAHLEDAVDVDLLSNDEISALESEGVEELGAGDGGHDKVWNATSSSNTCGAVASADTSIIDQVKQPLSNVDRYSMLGGQIS
ncbi:unnamed protein product [Mesocestoides corti]|uniref:Uncharacterized protein n=1 Tax=Mesocestoides corti TaxID=53468 RepID=A0A3P6H9D0_MESCO|nr:unnamed protein product [Mesocestoides corti]